MSHYQQLPEGWAVTRLADIAWFGGGKTPSTENRTFWDNGTINWITSKDMKEPIIIDSKIKLSAIGASQSTIYPKGTLLIVTRSGILRRTLPLAITGKESAVNQDIKTVTTPFDGLTEYLYWYFTANENEILEKYQKDGTTVESIDFEKFQNIEVFLPPLEEQERITKQLKTLLQLIEAISSDSDRIKTAIERTKLKILELAMQGKLVPQNPNDEPAADMLRRINPKAKIITDNPHYPQLPENWVLTTIDSVCLYGNSKTIPVSDINAEDWILELEDMESYTGRLLQIKSKKERVISGSRHSFKSGDILFSRLRTYLNKVHLSTNRGFCSTEMIPITPFKCVVSEYLYYWLRSPFFIEYTISCGYGVKMPRLSTSDANKAIIPLPPLDEQKRIVETIQRFHDGFDRITNALN